MTKNGLYIIFTLVLRGPKWLKTVRYSFFGKNDSCQSKSSDVLCTERLGATNYMFQKIVHKSFSEYCRIFFTRLDRRKRGVKKCPARVISCKS